MKTNSNFSEVFYKYILILGNVAMSIAVGLYAYLGSFSRYLSDDYCETVRMTSNTLINAVVERYSIGAWRAANRYSNILFVGLSEMLGENAMQITMAGMILLWAIGMIWSMYELRKFLKVNWNFLFDVLLGLTFTFFSLLQAPHLFQTVYWRSAMMTHFAPLVFGSFLFAFVLRQIRTTEKTSWWVGVFIFIASFILAGFSEPPPATAVTGLVLLLGINFYFRKSFIYKKSLSLLTWALAGTLIGLLVMILSPANAGVAQEKGVNMIEILTKSFIYSYQFIVDTLKTQPLPILVSIFIPFSLIWLYKQTDSSGIKNNQNRYIWIIFLIIPFLMWILIAASFSPSVYGQSFPIERARFLGRCMMIASFMLTGGLLGLLMQNIQFKPNPVLGQWAVLAVLAITSVVYPLRTAYYLIIFNVPEYQERARLWDLRDAFIKRHALQGETELVVPGFSGVYGIKEIDDNPNHWVNVCAAEFYGLNSIRVVGVDNVEEILNE
ncbi:MAG TPA: hypothetical protein DIW23_06795 [Anaerolineae bacterium]|nr:hypothetical protein [Anaerolineae bacterium]